MADNESVTVRYKGKHFQFDVPTGSSNEFLKKTAAQMYAKEQQDYPKQHGQRLSGKPAQIYPPLETVIKVAGYPITDMMSLLANQQTEETDPNTGEDTRPMYRKALSGLEDTAQSAFDLLALPAVIRGGAKGIWPAIKGLAGYQVGSAAGETAGNLLDLPPEVNRGIGQIAGLGTGGVTAGGSPKANAAVKEGMREGRFRAENAQPSKVGTVVGGMTGAGVAGGIAKVVGGGSSPFQLFPELYAYREGSKLGKDIHPIEFAKGFAHGAKMGARGESWLPSPIHEPSPALSVGGGFASGVAVPPTEAPLQNGRQIFPNNSVSPTALSVRPQRAQQTGWTRTTGPQAPTTIQPPVGITQGREMLQIESPTEGPQRQFNIPPTEIPQLAAPQRGPIVTPPPAPLPPSRQIEAPLPWRGPGDVVNTGKPQVFAPSGELKPVIEKISATTSEEAKPAVAETTKIEEASVNPKTAAEEMIERLAKKQPETIEAKEAKTEEVKPAEQEVSKKEEPTVILAKPQPKLTTGQIQTDLLRRPQGMTLDQIAIKYGSSVEETKAILSDMQEEGSAYNDGAYWKEGKAPESEAEPKVAKVKPPLKATVLTEADLEKELPDIKTKPKVEAPQNAKNRARLATLRKKEVLSNAEEKEIYDLIKWEDKQPKGEISEVKNQETQETSNAQQQSEITNKPETEKPNAQALLKVLPPKVISAKDISEEGITLGGGKSGVRREKARVKAQEEIDRQNKTENLTPEQEQVRRTTVDNALNKIKKLSVNDPEYQKTVTELRANIPKVEGLESNVVTYAEAASMARAQSTTPAAMTRFLTEMNVSVQDPKLGRGWGLSKKPQARTMIAGELIDENLVKQHLKALGKGPAEVVPKKERPTTQAIKEHGRRVINPILAKVLGLNQK